MKRAYIYKYMILVLIMASACQLLQPSNVQPPPDLALAWQADLDQMTQLYSGLPIPQYFIQEDPVLQGDEFEVMRVFEVLDRLHMTEGYRLAYYYHYDGMGAYPVLYALAEGSPPYLTEKAYQAAHPQCFQEDARNTRCDYLQNVESDGSELGYLQLVQLSIMGGQFYLNWHANYNDRTPIATTEELEKLIEKLENTDFGIPLSRKQARQARDLDPTPLVEIGEGSAAVRVLHFTSWGGFYETWYEVSTSLPHTVSETKDTLLLEYDCGIRF